MEVKELKKLYGDLESKYKLPTFKELDDNFEIAKIERESDTILRSIRKQMMEKIVNSVGFAEMLLNSANVPRMYFAYVKTISNEDKKTLEGIFSVFSEMIVSSLQAEVEYSEKNEAELIKEINKNWKANKEGFMKVLTNVKKPIKVPAKKDKSYFG